MDNLKILIGSLEQLKANNIEFNTGLGNINDTIHYLKKLDITEEAELDNLLNKYLKDTVKEVDTIERNVAEVNSLLDMVLEQLRVNNVD